jgi:hypothetical protein
MHLKALLCEGFFMHSYYIFQKGMIKSLFR